MYSQQQLAEIIIHIISSTRYPFLWSEHVKFDYEFHEWNYM